MLWLDAHSAADSGYSASAWHNLDIDTPGLLEMSLNLYVTPAEQQYVWRHKLDNCLAYIKFYSVDEKGAPKDQVAQVGVQLNKDETACRLYIYSQAGPNAMNGGSDSPSSKTNSPVLPTGKWVSLRMRMDPGSSMLSLAMDGQVAVSTPYDTTKVHNIGRFQILSAFGDGGARTD